MTENLLIQVGQDNLEENLNKAVEGINDEIKVLASQNLADLEDRMQKLLKQIEEDV